MKISLKFTKFCWIGHTYNFCFPDSDTRSATKRPKRKLFLLRLPSAEKRNSQETMNFSSINHCKKTANNWFLLFLATIYFLACSNEQKSLPKNANAILRSRQCFVKNPYRILKSHPADCMRSLTTKPTPILRNFNSSFQKRETATILLIMEMLHGSPRSLAFLQEVGHHTN